MIIQALISSFLFAIVCSALYQVADLLFQDIANLLQKALSMMKNIVFVLNEGETEHKEHSRRATQSLLALFGAKQGLN